ncbi:IS30 family transposase, partial [Aeromonas veronii]|uniref:IS30 family transposase n=1 Tax=Aeromonas veronii TaxID=654 RepID=UPI00355BD197
GPRNPSRSRKRLLKTALRDNYLEKRRGAETYFAHPYSSWERGLNENSNGLLRQFIPKGTDLREVTDEDVRRAEQWLNLRPRKCLGFRQPVKVFEEYRQAA